MTTDLDAQQIHEVYEPVLEVIDTPIAWDKGHWLDSMPNNEEWEMRWIVDRYARDHLFMACKRWLEQQKITRHLHITSHGDGVRGRVSITTNEYNPRHIEYFWGDCGEQFATKDHAIVAAVLHAKENTQ